METRLGAVQRSVPPACFNQLIMRAVFDQTAALDRHDPVSEASLLRKLVLR